MAESGLRICMPTHGKPYLRYITCKPSSKTKEKKEDEVIVKDQPPTIHIPPNNVHLSDQQKVLISRVLREQKNNPEYDQQSIQELLKII